MQHAGRTTLTLGPSNRTWLEESDLALTRSLGKKVNCASTTTSFIAIDLRLSPNAITWRAWSEYKTSDQIRTQLRRSRPLSKQGWKKRHLGPVQQRISQALRLLIKSSFLGITNECRIASLSHPTACLTIVDA